MNIRNIFVSRPYWLPVFPCPRPGNKNALHMEGFVKLVWIAKYFEISDILLEISITKKTIQGSLN